ncbi:MAG: glycine--tRNA ligase [Firmicutes bacterium]|nr:glycine--tRNA ligase [Bacillota bacterium]
MNALTFEKLFTHLTSTGFVFQGSEIYGGLSNTWDYGPLGVELINNLKKTWWKRFVQESPMNIGIDSAILMNPRVWEATGHVATFNDPLVDCKNCKTRHRADQLIAAAKPNLDVSKIPAQSLGNVLKEEKIACPKCGSHDFTDIRQFNMMFKTHIGVIEDAKTVVYLRPETAQGVFVNFKSIQRTTRKKVPFGVASVGKAFRNEITPGNFTFRTREFSQMELEFFCKPGTEASWYKFWQDACMQYLASLGIQSKHLRIREHSLEELAFYSKGTSDIEYQFPFGWGEVWGIASRTDYDLRQHMQYSKEDLQYLDPESNEKYIPYVIEPSLGLDRLALMVLSDAYQEETLENDTRVVLKLHPAIAPYKIAILPLSKQLNEKAQEVMTILSKHFMVTSDESGSIGKRYRRQDMIGTPFCVTIDFDTQNDQSVTIRDRDSMKQLRMPIDDLIKYFNVKLFY